MSRVPLSNPFNVHAFNSQPTGPGERDSAPIPAVRFKVKEISYGGNTKIVRAVRWNGDTEGKTSQAIVVLGTKAVSDPVYAIRPSGGTGEKIGGKNVVWREMGRGGRFAYQVGKIATDWTPGDLNVTLDPCDIFGTDNGEANVTVRIEWGAGSAPPLSFGNYATEVLPYFEPEPGSRFLASYRRFQQSSAGYDYLGNAGTPSQPNFIPMPIKAI